MSTFSNHRSLQLHQGREFHRMELAAALVLVIPVILLILPTTNAADSSGLRRLGDLPLPGSPQQTSNDSPPTEKDCQFALFARDALLQDEILGPLNVGVSVRSGVATLWGAVPYAALAHRAEERIRLVPGLAQVRNELRISVPEDDLAEFPKGPVPNPHVPIQEPKRWDHSAPLVSRGEEVRSSSRRTGAPLLMPSIEIPPGQTKTVSSFGPATNLKPSSGQPLIVVLEKLRRNNESFQGIRFEVQQGVVHLWGNAAAGEEVFNLAQQVAHLPGVQRVVVERSR